MVRANLLAAALALAASISLGFAPAYAEDPEAITLSRQLVRLLRYEQQMDQYRKLCAGTAKTVPPESLVKDSPGKYYGIQPNDRYWPDVVQAYEEYFRDICAKPTLQEFLDSMADVYATKVSVADLRAAVAFYSTEAGKRLVDGHKMTADAIYDITRRAYAAEVPIASRKFDEKLEAIARKAKADGKCKGARPLSADNSTPCGSTGKKS